MSNIFAKRLKDSRIKSRLTQSQLAKKIGVASSSIGMYEQARREPDNETLLKLCSALNTSTDYLLGLDSTSDNREVNDIIDRFTAQLETQDGLMFDGEPMNAEDRKKIVEAIKVAAAVVINQTPKKRRNAGEGC